MAEPQQLNVVWEVPGPVVREFMNSTAFVRGLMGPIGSGKSVACVIFLCFKALTQELGPENRAGKAYRKTRFAIVRNTFSELKTTTIKTFFDWFDKGWGKWKSEGPPTFTLNYGDIQAEFLFLEGIEYQETSSATNLRSLSSQPLSLR